MNTTTGVPLTLTGATPTGGQYSGNNTNNGLAPDNYQITYEYTDLATGCLNSCNFIITVSNPAITSINDDNISDISVCEGTTSENEVIDKLEDNITITDSEGTDHSITLDWTITGYNPDVPGDYNAISTFILPSNVTQSTPETPLQTTAKVIVMALPEITCPTNTSTTVNKTIILSELAGLNPVGGTFSGNGVQNGIFDPTGLTLGDHTITYFYNDNATGCSNSCTFIITVNYPVIASVNDDNVQNIGVCEGTSQSEAITYLEDEITITDSEGTNYTVILNWTITGYNPDIAGDYNALGTFTLPPNVIQSSPELPLQTTAKVTVHQLPVVSCPDNVSVNRNTITVLEGATPKGGVYSGEYVNDGEFDSNNLESSFHTYTYTDANTGCSNSCQFIVSVTLNSEIFSAESINIYPNPSEGTFYTNLGDFEGEANYQIYDVNNKLIFEENSYYNRNSVKEIYLNVAPGLYNIKINIGVHSFAKKLIIE